ncbi:spo11/DNA topoisomerase VI, subunit A protein isoform X3 [Tasmannia lanceolata]|uniref:spo11/DNA topoisomerase VI, subunit A protein isoform X3 n=1 Tax=Tasmannia lanceolata TaxID=3420 RepID=UPI0040628D02
MERRASSSKPFNLLKKIRGFTRSLLEDLCNRQHLPSVTLNHYRNYCTDPSGNCCCNSDSVKGKDILCLERAGQAYRLDVLLRVLLIIQRLLQENKHVTKRDIYYTHPSVFLDQAVVDRAINDICILLQCSRHNLNVVSVGKGLVMGWLRFLEAGKKVDCIRNRSTAYPVPVHVEEVEGISNLCRCVTRKWIRRCICIQFFFDATRKDINVNIPSIPSDQSKLGELSVENSTCNHTSDSAFLLKNVLTGMKRAYWTIVYVCLITACLVLFLLPSQLTREDLSAPILQARRKRLP